MGTNFNSTPQWPLTNAQIALLLGREAKGAEGHLRRALSKAANNAFLWPREAAEIRSKSESLTQLSGVGPHLAKLIDKWLEDPPAVPEKEGLTFEFLTLAEARVILEKHPDWLREYQGDLQMHSTWSDGSGSIAEMAAAAVERGYKYIGITDHSEGLKIAGGLSADELNEQALEIDQINEQLAKHKTGFRVIKSIEVNLSTTGEPDMPRECLNKLEVVVGSFHSALRVKEDQTARYLMALQSPQFHILGHPQGRVFNYRAGLQADWPNVFAAAAASGKALEIDSYPDRQDLKLSLLRLARKEGALFAIDTDAHAPGQLGFVELGLATAIQAGIPREKIINFWPIDRLLGWAEELRHPKQNPKSRRSNSALA